MTTPRKIVSSWYYEGFITAPCILSDFYPPIQKGTEFILERFHILEDGDVLLDCWDKDDIKHRFSFVVNMDSLLEFTNSFKGTFTGSSDDDNKPIYVGDKLINPFGYEETIMWCDGFYNLPPDLHRGKGYKVVKL